MYSLVNNTAPILTSSLGSLYYGYTVVYMHGCTMVTLKEGG